MLASHQSLSVLIAIDSPPIFLNDTEPRSDSQQIFDELMIYDHNSYVY